MAKTRIYAIAKELGVASKDVISFLEGIGVEAKSSSSSIEEAIAEKVRQKFGGKSGSETAASASDAVGSVSETAETKEKPAEAVKVKAPAKPQGTTQAKPEAKAKNSGNADAADGAAKDGDRPKRPRPRPKKKIAVVFNREYSKQGGGGNRPQENGARRPSEQRRSARNTDTQRRGTFRAEGGPRVIRPRPESERTVRPEATKPRPEEEIVITPPEPEKPQVVEPKPEIAAPKQPETVRVEKKPQQQENKNKKFDKKNNDRKGNERNGKPVESEANKSNSKGKGGRDNNKNKKRNQDHDALGKKKESFVNLEKNAAKKPKKNAQKAPERNEDEILTLILPEHLTIRELADKMKVTPSAIVKKLFMKGQMFTQNQDIDYAQAEEIALEFNCICEPEEKVDVIAELLKEEEEDPAKMKSRPPVVCVMGHVDHGKTSLLDAIRDTRVTAKEAGGITQKIGAYVVSINDQDITFLDTPGHEAFTAMRMRGANSTDIAILVVAADDGVMPQTVEAINHAKAAGIEIIVAINKIDKPNANIDRVKQELSEYELIPEDWGGSTIFVPVSAHTHEGIEQLLEMILLTAEVLELKSNPNRNARGLVIEAELDKGRGAVATVLVQKGTLKVGDPIAAGSSFGRVRAMIDDNGRNVKSAGPSVPVEILGLSEVPNAGEIFVAMDSEKEARSFAQTFVSEGKNRMVEESRMKMSLDDLFSQIKAGNLKELDIIVKADVQGSVEAVKQSLEKLSNDEVIVKVIHGGVGAINESDVTLASASNAIIIGFNVRPDPIAKQTADQEGVDVRLYKVIYNAIEDVEAAMKGMLEPIFEEKVIGHAEVRQIFKSSDVGNIAGSYILDGSFERNCKIRITRGEEQIYEGSLASLKRFKDDVKEVKAGYECGLVFDGFDAIMEEDKIEAYIMVEVAR